jgi:hypothetical protein
MGRKERIAREVAAMPATATVGTYDYIETFTGKLFYPLDPNPEDIDPKDIAHALSMKCRYTGHTREFYSVAQHSVLMSWEVMRRMFDARSSWMESIPSNMRYVARWALLHDAVEAYLPDVARPLKKFFPSLVLAERNMEKAICERFGLQLPMPATVKDLDARILLSEAQALMPSKGEVFRIDGAALDIPITSWSPFTAERHWLATADELGIK